MEELIAITEIITVYVCKLTIARNAFNIGSGFAMAAILKLLNLITWRRIVIPFMNNCAIIYGLIPTILTLILFASKSDNDKDGNGYGYFFHKG